MRVTFSCHELFISDAQQSRCVRPVVGEDHAADGDRQLDRTLLRVSVRTCVEGMFAYRVAKPLGDLRGGVRVGAREDEDELLEGSGHRSERSRLSCQIRMDDSLSGLRVTVAPED